MKNQDAVEDFYRAVAQLLDETHSYRPFPFGRRTRWNNRTAGNGRFPNRGLVRYYSPTCIHISLTSPPIQGTFSSSTAALLAISESLERL